MRSSTSLVSRFGALSWDSRCFMVRGPIIGAVTAGCSSTEGDGELDQRDAGLLGEGRQLIDRFELALVAR